MTCRSVVGERVVSVSVLKPALVLFGSMYWYIGGRRDGSRLMLDWGVVLYCTIVVVQRMITIMG